MNILKLFRHQKDNANASVTPKIGQKMYRKGNDIVEMERCQSPSVVMLNLTQKSLVPVGSVTCMKKQLSGFLQSSMPPQTKQNRMRLYYSTTVPSLMSSVALNRRRLHARGHAPRPRSAAAAAVQQSRMWTNYRYRLYYSTTVPSLV